jgi:hypothetical protein
LRRLTEHWFGKYYHTFGTFNINDSNEGRGKKIETQLYYIYYTRFCLYLETTALDSMNFTGNSVTPDRKVTKGVLMHCCFSTGTTFISPKRDDHTFCTTKGDLNINFSFFKWLNWGWNSGLYVCNADILLLEPHLKKPEHFLLWLFCR